MQMVRRAWRQPSAPSDAWLGACAPSVTDAPACGHACGGSATFGLECSSSGSSAGIAHSSGYGSYTRHFTRSSPAWIKSGWHTRASHRTWCVACVRVCVRVRVCAGDDRLSQHNTDRPRSPRASYLTDYCEAQQDERQASAPGAAAHAAGEPCQRGRWRGVLRGARALLHDHAKTGRWILPRLR